MRKVFISVIVVAGLLLLLPLSPARAASEPAEVTEFWYAWGDNEILGAKVWAFASTNLTMNVSHIAADGSRIQDVAEFRIHAVVPGGDPYPPSNGTNPFPYPQISAIYDSEGFSLHQVLEMRFLRLIEFQDSNGDGAYSAGEPVDSQVDLSDLSVRYEPPDLDGLDNTSGLLALPFRNHYPNVCCGESWDGWISQSDALFPAFAGLIFRLSAIWNFNFTITGYDWFVPRVFQGVNVTPTLVKLDFQIEDYPFVSPTSRLALEVNLTSFGQGAASGWNVVPWPEGQGLGSDAGNSSALFAWSGTATADGVSAPVAATSTPADAYSRHLFLSYPHASIIAHDPVLGITDKRLAGGEGFVPPTSLNTAFIAFGATLGVSAVVIYAIERRKR